MNEGEDCWLEVGKREKEREREREREMTQLEVKGDMIEWFEGIAKNAGSVQTETLRTIIELNHGTEYLRKWLGSDMRLEDMDAEALESHFTSSVPLASHADLEPYIQRIANGDTSPILTQHPITMLSLSSGTTDGRPKYVPFTRFSSQSTLQISKLAAAYRSRVFPTRSGGRILDLIYSSKRFETKGGISVGTATSHVFASEEFKTKQKSTGCFTLSPYEVISAGDYKQSTYCHLLLGLLFSSEVELVASTFAYSIVQAFTALEELWEELCVDIHTASLNTSRVSSPKMRRAVLGLMGASPNPELASEIERKVRGLENWGGVIPELWPNAKYIYSIMTGSMLPYLRKLRHYGGELPLVCADYGSTESWIGVNIRPSDPPERVLFTVVPTFSYFEFIPLPRDQLQDSDGVQFALGQPLPLSKVELGQQYEIVLTTFTGLYRYRLGDVVEVAGFYKGTPQLSFICRRKLILTVNIDKNTERDLQLVVERGCTLLATMQSKAELVDFTSHANIASESEPGHYVIYWETKGVELDDDEGVLQQCCCEMDASFADHGYRVSRRCRSIWPLELRIVESGTFGRIMDYYIDNGAAVSQFKTPRCTSNQDLLAILDQCTVRRFWSTAYG